MFCPVCRCEYLEGIAQCIDCGIPLVEQIPENPDDLPYELRDLIIFKSFPHHHEAEIAAGLLQANGIDAITTLEDWGRLTSSKTGQMRQGVRLMIREADILRAEAVFLQAGIHREDNPDSSAYPPLPSFQLQASASLMTKILLILSILMILAIIWTYFT